MFADSCKLYRNTTMILEKKLKKSEIQNLIKLINKIAKKSKKRPYVVTNTYSTLNINGEKYEFYYIPKEEEDIFKIMQYENKILVNDESIVMNRNFLFDALNEYGSFWKIICESKLCRVIYYSNYGKMDKPDKEWSIIVNENQKKEIEKELIAATKNRYKEEIRSETKYRMIFDDGKEYHYVVSDGQFEKILNDLIKSDYNEIEKEYIEQH